MAGKLGVASRLSTLFLLVLLVMSIGKPPSFLFIGLEWINTMYMYSLNIYCLLMSKKMYNVILQGWCRWRWQRLDSAKPKAASSKGIAGVAPTAKMFAELRDFQVAAAISM